MSKYNESLKANEAEILEALPEELRENFKKKLDETPDEEKLKVITDKIEAIKAERVANPDVDAVD